ncbi:MAG: ParA family protein [Planctomycetota bacterium]|jgi:chromosome partitioning protein
MHGVKVYAIINQKGGVGKTTTVVNLGAAVAARGYETSLIDLDPQGHLSLHFGIEPTSTSKNIYDVMINDAELSSVLVEVAPHLRVVPSTIDLAAAEVELVSTPGREQILRESLSDNLHCELVMIDCPPSLGLLTLNALAAADEVLIPLQPHFLALQGLGKLLETVSLVQRRINPKLRVAGIIFCMYETTTRLAAEVAGDLENFLASARGSDTPWAQAKIFQQRIRRNIKLAECPSYGQTIFNYEPYSHGAQDYCALGEEFLAVAFGATDEPAESEREETPSPDLTSQVEAPRPQIESSTYEPQQLCDKPVSPDTSLPS